MNSRATKELEEALMNNDSDRVCKVFKRLKKQNSFPLNIGITGEAGSGKSTFVNAFRGIGNNHWSAAPTGCVETTTDIKPYPHPHCANVVLWDLPGVGTTRFPAQKYVKYVELEKLDFFVIISDTRFRENDVRLAQEIRKMGKSFYFVRSKIDNDLRAEERSQRNFNRTRTLSKIKHNCVQGLQNQGFESPQVFLLSSFELRLHDFPLLQQTFSGDLPALRKHALLLAMATISQKIINRKKESFQAYIKYYAAASAAGAAVPIPGLSVAVDAGMIATVGSKYSAGFGLDVPSLQRLAARTGVDYADVKSVIKSPLAGTAITTDLMLKVLGQLTFLSALMAAEEGSKFIPFVGTIVAMSLSSVTTYRALNFFLDVLADDAQRVFKRAYGSLT